MIRFVGISVPVQPKQVLSLSGDASHKHLQELLLKELEVPAYSLPKKFDRLKLLADIKMALSR